MPRLESGLGTMGLAVALVLGACGDGPSAADDALEGGVLATFAVGNERFQVWILNPAAIAELLQVQAGRSQATIPNGAIRTGPGESAYNAPWSWHLDAQDIAMADLTIEVCDGAPSYVEAHLTDYLQIGRYCPWGARLVGLDDRR